MTPLEPQFVPPPIGPVPAGIQRPLWSVMIPTYNCAQYLRQTLESVLAQDPGPDQMQIEVVDDCSTADNPEAVVRAVAGDRVRFYRKEKNGGAIANFNTCIERSAGQLVHILHGDDWVAPGFYRKFSATAEAHPSLALLACRSFFVDEAGIIAGVSERILPLEKGGTAADPFFYGTPIQTASVVVRRSLYEREGGFLPSLLHTADCEMWCRATVRGGGLVLPEVLSNYRVFSANDSSRLARSAENLRDMERLNQLFATRHPEFNRLRARMRTAQITARQIEHFRTVGDADALEANLAFWRMDLPFSIRFPHTLRRLARILFRAAIERQRCT